MSTSTTNDTEQLTTLCQKMQESLNASKELLQNGHEGFAVSRAYFAMVNVTHALLLAKELPVPPDDQATLAAFGKQFVDAGTFESVLRDDFNRAFEERLEADYGTSKQFSGEEATEALQRAKSFCQVVEGYLVDQDLLPAE